MLTTHVHLASRLRKGWSCASTPLLCPHCHAKGRPSVVAYLSLYNRKIIFVRSQFCYFKFYKIYFHISIQDLKFSVSGVFAALKICGPHILLLLTTEHLIEGARVSFSGVVLIPSFVKIGRIV